MGLLEILIVLVGIWGVKKLVCATTVCSAFAGFLGICTTGLLAAVGAAVFAWNTYAEPPAPPSSESITAPMLSDDSPVIPADAPALTADELDIEERRWSDWRGWLNETFRLQRSPNGDGSGKQEFRTPKSSRFSEVPGPGPASPSVDDAVVPDGMEEQPTKVIVREFLKDVILEEHSLNPQTGEVTIPNWATESPQVHDRRDAVEIVWASERFATLDEARDQLWRQVSEEIFHHIPRPSLEPHVLTLSYDDAMKLGIIQKECQITWPLQVGGFTESVIQVCWQVRLTPEHAERILAMNRRGAVSDRVNTLLAGLGIMTGVLGVGSLISRRRARRQPRPLA